MRNRLLNMNLRDTNPTAQHVWSQPGHAFLYKQLVILIEISVPNSSLGAHLVALKFL